MKQIDSKTTVTYACYNFIIITPTTLYNIINNIAVAMQLTTDISNHIANAENSMLTAITINLFKCVILSI